MPGSSINSWDSWFIFNLRKINTCYYADNRHWSWRVHMWQCCASRYIQHTCIDNVHTWASVFLRHLASSSFMVPFWPYTDSGSLPILAVRSHACPEDAVYSFNDDSSYFAQRIFPPSGFSPTYRKYLIIIQGNGTHLYYTSHSYVHSYPHIYITFIYTFTSSFLHFFCSSWQAGCPRLFVSYTIRSFKNSNYNL